MDRIFNINKPAGMTSHDVVARVRRIMRTKKVGHTGTLDPDATGVLPICVGRATKVSDLVLNKDKVYVCEMTIGSFTDTYDSSGETLESFDTSKVTKEEVEAAIRTQVGKIDQFPPIYSALKVNGKKMCDLARAGRADEITLVARPVEVKYIKVISMELPKVMFEVECSKGTYIRSICNDIGKVLGVGAHMSYLQRTRSGVFDISRSMTLEELEEMRDDEDKLIENSYSIEEVLVEFPYLVLHPNAVKYYSNGGTIEGRRFTSGDYTKEDTRVRVYTPDKEFIGIGKLRREGEELSVKSEKIFRIG